jgi:hypothetical protein
MYVIAGRQGSLASNMRTVESWHPGDAAWRTEPALVNTRGGIAASTTDTGKVCVAGGEQDGGTIPSVECLSSSGWRVAATLQVPRHGLAVVAVENALHVIAGGPQPGLTVSDAHERLQV